MPITSLHPEYKKNCIKWKLVRKIVQNDAHEFIYPYENATTYQKQVYVDQGYLVNFTHLTMQGLVGLVFKKPLSVEVAPDLDYILSDVNGEGLDITQFSQMALGELLQTGRIGLLVDHPKIDTIASLQQQEQQQLKSRIIPYTSESIINWKTKKIGSKQILSMVVLRELNYENEDEFSWGKKEQYRCLKLDDDGYYYQYLSDENGKMMDDPIWPVDGQGRFFDYIPFIFCGAVNNDLQIDPAPLYDIARVNLQHYRNSCDLEENIRIHGQATLILGGEMDVDSFMEQQGGRLSLGVGQAYYLGSQPYAELLQAGPNQMVSQEMKRKEEQIVLMGARVITPPGGRETAEGARIRYSSQNSALYTLTTNLSKCIRRAIEIVAQFMDTDQSVMFELNKKFYDEKADPNLIAQQMLMLDRGVISRHDVRSYLKETNVLDESRTDDAIDTDVDLEIDPLQGLDNES